jgi:two-component system cell cycle sensor histidine kinase/response regulator CckA
MAAARVLLVEDDPAFAGLLTADLAADAGEFALTVAGTLRHGLARFVEQPADAVLLDLNLPDSEGLATVRSVRRAVPRETPLLVLTGLDDVDMARAAMQEGAQDYLVKGRDDRAAIVRALRYAIERSNYRRRLMEAEEALRQSEAQLRQAHKMEAVGRLAGGIAHDFNNVLTAIFGYTDLILEDVGPGDRHRGDVLEIRRAAERAASLTRQLLAFSRKQVMMTRRLNLRQTVGNLQGFLSRLIGSDIELVIDGDPALGDVLADQGQIEQVLMNLAANARDAMPDGGRLSITLRNIDMSAEDANAFVGLHPGELVGITVTDTGHGIPESVRKNVFEPFFTTKAQGQGTGLGLAMVYGIVKQSGGWIYLDSTEGQGTTFTIFLPRLAPEDSQASAHAGPGRLILVVEDDDPIRHLTVQSLRRQGHRVIEARSREEALAAAAPASGIDVVVSDLRLPDGDGRDVVREIRRRLPGVRVLLMSGYGELAGRAGEEAVDPFLEKPFTPHALARAVQTLISA